MVPPGTIWGLICGNSALFPKQDNRKRTVLSETLKASRISRAYRSGNGSCRDLYRINLRNSKIHNSMRPHKNNSKSSGIRHSNLLLYSRNREPLFTAILALQRLPITRLTQLLYRSLSSLDIERCSERVLAKWSHTSKQGGFTEQILNEGY